MYKHLYLLFQYNIKAYIPEIKYVSLYNRQFDNIQGEREYPFPACLVEILPMTFDNIGNFNQTTIANVRLHVGTEIYEGLEFGDSQQNDALDHLSLLDKFHYVLNNIATDTSYVPENTTLSGITYDYTGFYIQSCRRKGTQTYYSQSSVRTSTIDFELFLLDQTAEPEYISLTGLTYVTSGTTLTGSTN